MFPPGSHPYPARPFAVAHAPRRAAPRRQPDAAARRLQPTERRRAASKPAAPAGGAARGDDERRAGVPASAPAASGSAPPVEIRVGHGFAAEENLWLMAARPDLTPNQGKAYR